MPNCIVRLKNKGNLLKHIQKKHCPNGYCEIPLATLAQHGYTACCYCFTPYPNVEVHKEFCPLRPAESDHDAIQLAQKLNSAVFQINVQPIDLCPDFLVNMEWSSIFSSIVPTISQLPPSPTFRKSLAIVFNLITSVINSSQASSKEIESAWKIYFLLYAWILQKPAHKLPKKQLRALFLKRIIKFFEGNLLELHNESIAGLKNNADIPLPQPSLEQSIKSATTFAHAGQLSKAMQILDPGTKLANPAIDSNFDKLISCFPSGVNENLPIRQPAKVDEFKVHDVYSEIHHSFFQVSKETYVT
jgi:hypothetical protein